MDCQKTPLISFVVPAYNSSSTLPRLFASFQRQSSSNFEIIIVDDGSTDETLYLCNKYQTFFDARLKIIHEDNSGPFRARITGVSFARGLYVAFVDSDDIISEEYVKVFETTFESLTAKPDLFVLDMVVENVAKKKRITHTCPFEEGYLSWEQYGVCLINGSLGFSALKVFAKRLFARIVFPSHNHSSMVFGEDLVLSMLLFSKEDTIYYVKKKLYFYILNKGGLSLRFGINHLLSSCELIDEKVKFMQTIMGFTNERIVNEIVPSLFGFLKSANKVSKSERKKAMAFFYGSYAFRTLFTTKKDLFRLFSLKEKAILRLVRIKWSVRIFLTTVFKIK